MYDVAYADGAGHGRGQRLKVRYLSGCLGFLVFLAGNDSDRVGEAANVDEPKVEGEVGSTRDQPNHNERQLGVAEGYGEKHDLN